MESQNYKGLKSFEELVIWQEARQLRNDIFQTAKSFPTEEKFKLTDQIIRSSRSVTANIAEGFGRYHYQEFIQFCRHARGSLLETNDHLMCALDCNYIDGTVYNVFKNRIEVLTKKINAFINYLKSAKTHSANQQINRLTDA